MVSTSFRSLVLGAVESRLAKQPLDEFSLFDILSELSRDIGAERLPSIVPDVLDALRIAPGIKPSGMGRWRADSLPPAA